eukprot:TRINITY_DN18974_c0_g1_i1.p2 TRINITY_DN18974_c0_g1~~TRINITY_DN18974_c0_g1_i1.p2  ORF type:complete len:113 (-),score=3.08 TRINITY_DN18974_c0_g1_i1:71-409(-)
MVSLVVRGGSATYPRKRLDGIGGWSPPSRLDIDTDLPPPPLIDFETTSAFAHTVSLCGEKCSGGASERGALLLETAIAAPPPTRTPSECCLLYTSDAADEEDSVDLGGPRVI